MISFDSLNTELLFEIFDYLSFTDIFRAFFNLQHRINNVIRAYPACINLSKTIDRTALVHGPFLCRALVVTDDYSQNNYSQFNFEAIRAIQFEHISSIKLQSLFKQLPIEQLESITIESLYRSNPSEDIEQQIWLTIATAGRNQLRYLRVSDATIRFDAVEFLFDMPSLQCVVFKEISAKEMLTFMHHTPNLRSFTGRIAIWDLDNYTLGFNLLKLTHLDLYIEYCDSFIELRQLLSICPYLTDLQLRFWIKYNNESMVNATEWQMLIEECFPYLIYLRIRLFRYTRLPDDFDPDDTFQLSNYWLTRQPNFDIQYMEV